MAPPKCKQGSLDALIGKLKGNAEMETLQRSDKSAAGVAALAYCQRSG